LVFVSITSSWNENSHEEVSGFFPIAKKKINSGIQIKTEIYLLPSIWGFLLKRKIVSKRVLYETFSDYPINGRL
jgi:hypothetical protein